MVYGLKIGREIFQRIFFVADKIYFLFLETQLKSFVNVKILNAHKFKYFNEFQFYDINY